MGPGTQDPHLTTCLPWVQPCPVQGGNKGGRQAACSPKIQREAAGLSSGVIPALGTEGGWGNLHEEEPERGLEDLHRQRSEKGVPGKRVCVAASGAGHMWVSTSRPVSGQSGLGWGGEADRAGGWSLRT